MKIYLGERQTVQKLVGIRCDCCSRHHVDQVELADFLSYSDVAGYGSPLGDGNKLELDLCRDCIQKVLGNYIRINSAQRDWGKVTWHQHLYYDDVDPADEEPLAVFDAVEIGDEFLIISPSSKEVIYGGTNRMDILTFAKVQLRALPWHERTGG